MAPLQPVRHPPIHDVHPLTGVSIEVFYADWAMETFGRSEAVGFGRCAFKPDGPATGPFATTYAAYRHAIVTARVSS